MFKILNHQGNANKTTRRFHLTPVRMVKRQVTADAGKDMEKEEQSSIVRGIEPGTTTLDSNLDIPQKIGNTST